MSFKFNPLFGTGLTPTGGGTPGDGILADGSVPFTGDQSMGGNQLTNVGAPDSDDDATNKEYVDDTIAAYVAANAANTALSNLTTTAINENLLPGSDGSYSLGSTPFSWLALYVRIIRDNSGVAAVDIDDRLLYANSDIKFNWSGTDPSLNSHKLIDVTDPTNPQDAATKAYVDDNAANVTLSNLTSPTAINQHLIPMFGSTFDLGLLGSVAFKSLTVLDIYNDSNTNKVISIQQRILYDNNGVPTFTWAGENTSFTDLIFDTGAAANIQTKNEAATTQGLQLSSGTASGVGNASGPVSISTGSADVDEDTGTIGISTADATGTGNSGPVFVTTGEVEDGNSGIMDHSTGGSITGSSGNHTINTGNAGGNSGNISLNIGTAGATRGKIQLADGSEGTAGEVWTSTDTAGSGAWAAPSSGFDILVFTATATVGGAASEALTVTGLLATDTIIAVTQKTGGGAALPLLAWSTQVDDGITGIWSADPGSGAVLLVAVKR